MIGRSVHTYKANHNQVTLLETLQTVLIAFGGKINDGPGEQQIRLVVFLSVTTLNDPYNVEVIKQLPFQKEIYQIIIF